MFPKGFDYYAGGHIHERGEFSLEGFQDIVFPGPLFTGYGRDLEATAMGEKRGIYIVEFDDRLRSKSFVPIAGLDGVFREYNLTGLNAREAGEKIGADFTGVEVCGKLVVIRAYGELAGGKASEVGFEGIRSGLVEQGAVHVYLNRHSLKTREVSQGAVGGQDPSAIERALFRKEVGGVSVSSKRLQGEEGAKTAVDLLGLLRQEPKLGESKKGYVARMVATGEKTLGITGTGKVQ